MKKRTLTQTTTTMYRCSSVFMLRFYSARVCGEQTSSVTAITDPKGEMVASMDIDSGKSIISYDPYGEIDRKNSSGHSKLSVWMKKKGLGAFNFNLSKLNLRRSWFGRSRIFNINKLTNHPTKYDLLKRRVKNGVAEILCELKHCQKPKDDLQGDDNDGSSYNGDDSGDDGLNTDFSDWVESGSTEDGNIDDIIPSNIFPYLTEIVGEPNEPSNYSYTIDDSNKVLHNLRTSETLINKMYITMVVRDYAPEAYPWDLCVYNRPACIWNGGTLDFYNQKNGLIDSPYFRKKVYPNWGSLVIIKESPFDLEDPFDGL